MKEITVCVHNLVSEEIYGKTINVDSDLSGKLSYKGFRQILKEIGKIAGWNIGETDIYDGTWKTVNCTLDDLRFRIWDGPNDGPNRNYDLWEFEVLTIINKWWKNNILVRRHGL